MDVRSIETVSETAPDDLSRLDEIQLTEYRASLTGPVFSAEKVVEPDPSKPDLKYYAGAIALSVK